MDAVSPLQHDGDGLLDLPDEGTCGSPMTQFEQTEAWSRQRDQLRQVVHNLGRRVQYEDSHGSSQASSLFLCPATVHRPMSQYYTTAGNVDISLKLDQVFLHIY